MMESAEDGLYNDFVPAVVPADSQVERVGPGAPGPPYYFAAAPRDLPARWSLPLRKIRPPVPTEN
jgi:hypothetical protein